MTVTCLKGKKTCSNLQSVCNERAYEKMQIDATEKAQF